MRLVEREILKRHNIPEEYWWTTNYYFAAMPEGQKELLDLEYEEHIAKGKPACDFLHPIMEDIMNFERNN